MATKKPPKPEKDEIATTEKDIDIFAGWIKRLENPDPVLRTEAAGKGLKLYDEVDRDAHAGSVLQTRYLAVVGKEWNVEPAKAIPGRGRPASETREQKIADFVREAFLDTNFDQGRQELLRAILYGYYVWEIMWDYSEGDVWIKKLISKHPRRFSFTPQRELRLLTRQNMIEGEPVPERKFIVFTYGSTDNPYGEGLGRKLWWPVWFKKHGVKFWAIFAEKFAGPTGVGKYPPGTSKSDQDLLLEALEAIQEEQGVIIPENMAIDLLEAARRSSVDTYEKFCEYMDKQISKAVLGQTATTEGTPGKLGSEETRENVRQDILKADADLLCEHLNATLIPWLVDFNHPDVSGYPQIWIHTEEEQDLKPLAERDKILVKDIGLSVGKQYFYDTYNVPKPEEDEELVSPPAPGPGAGFAESADGQDQIDRIITRVASEANPFFSGWRGIIEGAAKEAQSFEELRTWIPGANLPDRDFIEHLAKKLLNADQIGTDSVLREMRMDERSAVGGRWSYQEAQWGPGLPFEEAIDYFRDRAFMISGITKADFLFEIKEEIIRAIEEGLTLGDFRKALPQIFERHGYAMLNPWRIANIYQTNLQDAYQAGRLRQQTDPSVMAARPYLRYTNPRDPSSRPEHAANHGKIYPIGHSFWQIWYPPNGYRCRCGTQTLSEREVRRNGWKIETEDSTGRLFVPVDPLTGERLPARPLMPDQGWDHMPGRIDLKALLNEKLAKLRA